MKRLSHQSKEQIRFIGWVQYVGLVLAFIGLWQLLSNGATAVHRLF